MCAPLYPPRTTTAASMALCTVFLLNWILIENIFSFFGLYDGDFDSTTRCEWNVRPTANTHTYTAQAKKNNNNNSIEYLYYNLFHLLHIAFIAHQLDCGLFSQCSQIAIVKTRWVFFSSFTRLKNSYFCEDNELLNAAQWFSICIQHSEFINELNRFEESQKNKKIPMKCECYGHQNIRSGLIFRGKIVIWWTYGIR